MLVCVFHKNRDILFFFFFGGGVLLCHLGWRVSIHFHLASSNVNFYAHSIMLRLYYEINIYTRNWINVILLTNL